jgi:transcriptional regulator with XRE-family HTH domain
MELADMAIGERIRFIRNLRGMTQKYLGMAVGFPERTADIRMAQYESGTRTPKADLTDALASALEVSPLALNVPDIDSYYGLMHTLFAIEDLYGLQIGKIDGEVCLHLDKSRGTSCLNMFEMFHAWQQEAEKLKKGEIAKEDYDQWRYTYPQIEAERTKSVLDIIRVKKNKGEE